MCIFVYITINPSANHTHSMLRKKISNKDLYKEIQKKALGAFLFMNKAFDYFTCSYHN